MNIEYELEQADLELNNVQINIPLPLGCTPVVSECDGQYEHEARRSMLVWTLPLIDASTKSGSMEFSAPSSNSADFFPLQVSFSSKTPYAKIKVRKCTIYKVTQICTSCDTSYKVTYSMKQYGHNICCLYFFRLAKFCT